jgi:hypothetical protein
MKNLLSAVLSTQGWYCVVALKKTGMPKQVFVQTLEEVETAAQDLLSKHYDVYFACSKYETNSTRTTDNVKTIKAFWLDIDCGPGKPYETQAEGLTAFKDFCAEIGLPKPSLVNSGRGLHAYWGINKELTRQEWKPIADQLKRACHLKGLEADPARTADAASILRIPDTKNFKGDPPLDVTLMCVSPEVDLEVFKNAIGVVDMPEAPDYGPSNLNELTKSLMGNKQNRFSVLWAKIENGTGCAQIEKAVKEQATVEEPLWRAALSIATYCVDRDSAIHEVSKEHEKYSPQETEYKANKIKGPYTCDAIDKINPGGCDNCAHKGKLSSPIVLGQEILEAESNEIEFKTEDVSKPVTYTIPEYPFPYFRGRNGGVYRRPDDEEDDPILVYEHDLYVAKRMKDPQHGETIWMRLHTPKDGVREFALPAVDLLTSDKLREKLAWYGVVGLKKQMDSIMSYLVRFVKELQCKEGAEIMRMQFGWTEKNGSFVIGDQEICPDGDIIEYSIPETKLLTKIEADELYPKLYTNYGHAGRIYIRDLVCNLEERIAEVKEVQRVIDKKIGFTSRERFWSAIAACNIAGALFARRLGLIDIDVGRVFKWMLKEFSQMREETTPPVSDFASVIGDFWNKHRQNTLVINDEVDKRTGVEMLPILEPRGELLLRMEPDTMKLFIVAKDFRKYCTECQITLKDVLNGLTSDGIYGGIKKKRMSKGTKLSSVPPVDVYVFDCSRGDFIDPDAYINAAQADADNESEEPVNEGEPA